MVMGIGNIAPVPPAPFFLIIFIAGIRMTAVPSPSRDGVTAPFNGTDGFAIGEAIPHASMAARHFLGTPGPSHAPHTRGGERPPTRIFLPKETYERARGLRVVCP